MKLIKTILPVFIASCTVMIGIPLIVMQAFASYKLRNMSPFIPDPPANWSDTELFEYLIFMSIISPDEQIGHWKREDMVRMVENDLKYGLN